VQVEQRVHAQRRLGGSKRRPRAHIDEKCAMAGRP
jgi:hypothetical protein